MVQQILVNGIMLGALYALLALGWSIIYGTARIANLAHTAFFMLAAYLLYTFFQVLDYNVWAAAVATIVLTTALGVLCYKAFIERIQGHEGIVFMITLALALVAQQAIILAYGGLFRGVNSFVSGYTELLGIRVTNQQLLALGVLLATIVLVTVFLYRSRLGLAIRVTAQDKEVANLVGINVGRMCMVTIAVGTCLAAIAGVVMSPIYVIQPYMWGEPLVIVMAVVVLGGLGSIKGSITGAFILGFTETIVVNLLPMGAFVKGAFALAIMIVVLVIRPEGLFGVAFEEERL